MRTRRQVHHLPMPQLALDPRRAVLLLLLLSPLAAFAQGSLSVTLTTASHGGKYAPTNVVAVWVEGPDGFVKTLGRWANRRVQHLVAWTDAAGSNDTDAVSGATRASHGSLTVGWDLKDKSGAIVPDGTYTIRMELADSNASSAGQNAQGTFSFVKGPTSSKQTTSGGGFSNVTITYTAASSGAGGGGGSSGTGGGSSGAGGGSSGTGGGSSGAGGGTGGASGAGGGGARPTGDGGADEAISGGCSATGGWNMAAAGWALLALARRRGRSRWGKAESGARRTVE